MVCRILFLYVVFGPVNLRCHLSALLLMFKRATPTRTTLGKTNMEPEIGLSLCLSLSKGIYIYINIGRERVRDNFAL